MNKPLMVNHPLFIAAYQNDWHECPNNVSSPYVFVFQRQKWKNPSVKQTALHERRKKIVEKLGGVMVKGVWELAGENPPLSAEDVREILASIGKDYPQAKIISHWNGEGCYSMSVGVDMGPRK